MSHNVNGNSMNTNNDDLHMECLEQEAFTHDDIENALTISGTGIWKLEAEKGKKIRFYGDRLMDELIGIEGPITPEERMTFFMSRIYPEDMQVFLSYYNNLKTHKSEIIYRYDHPKKGVLYVRCGGKKDDRIKEFDCYRGFHQDVTNTIRVEQDARKHYTEESELYQKMASKLMENFTTSAMYIDVQNRSFKWLSLREKILEGIDDYAELGKAYSAIMPEEYASQFLEKASFHNLKKELSDKDEYSFSVYINGEKGELRRITMWYYAVDESRRYLLAVSKDTTEDYRKEQELAEALVAADRANKAKTIFLSNMSHDIRTPMNAIVGFKELATRHIDDRKRSLDYLDKIGKSSEHLLSLINDVLDMSRIESGKMKFVYGEVSLSDIISGIETIFVTEAKKKEIQLHIESSITNDTVLCDKLRINQILLNCMSNAMKFTPSGGDVFLSLKEIPCDKEGFASYQFIVRDTGIGMSSDFIKTIFDPFSREEKGSVHQIQGTGLGMSICKSIVDKMDGTIEVQSEEGKGSSFTISLPMQIAGEKKVEKTDNRNQKKADDGEISLEGKRILLVDDNEINREIALVLLSDFGALVETAENGQIGVEKIKASAPGYYDCVLMDVQMPIMNGYEAARAIRALDREDANKIVIFAMTANAFEEDRKLALDAGMNEHLTKPINITKLLETLKQYT